MRSHLTAPSGASGMVSDVVIGEDVVSDDVDGDAEDAAHDEQTGDDELRDETLETTGADSAAGLTPQADDEMLAALVRRIVYQDEAALAALYRALSSRIFAQAMRITRDVGRAQEVVEDVFWQVWRQAPRFDSQRGTALAWVRRITRSRALDALRSMGRDPLRRAVELDGGSLVEPGSSHDDPPHRMRQAQSAASIEQALAALDPVRRQLVALAFQRGCSQCEIAEQTGLPLGTVKSHIRRALTLMKTSIEAAEGPRPLPQDAA